MNKVTNQVTIVSANYNNGGFLTDYFESIVNSNLMPFECIICDDGSTDDSVSIIKKYADLYSWITPIFFPKNKGVAHATNAALEKVTTDYILRLDSDDMLLPKRIENQLHFLMKNPSVDVLGGNCIYFDSATYKEMHRSNFPVEEEKIKTLFFIGENGVLNGTTMVKKKWFDAFRYDQAMVWAEDYDAFARMLHAGATFHGQSEPLTKVRIHRSSATSNLAFDTLQKAHAISVRLFSNQTTEKQLKKNYNHLLNYRKFMMSTNPYVRIIALIKSIYYRPDKVINRLFNR